MVNLDSMSMKSGERAGNRRARSTEREKDIIGELIDLYLCVKVRPPGDSSQFDEENLNHEKEKILKRNLSATTLIEYIKASIQMLFEIQKEQIQEYVRGNTTIDLSRKPVVKEDIGQKKENKAKKGGEEDKHESIPTVELLNFKQFQ